MKTVIRIDNLNFSWEKNHEIFTGLDFSVEQGETVGVVGSNGAGKTTLFLLIAGLVKPESGAIEVLGEEPGSSNLRGRVGLVFQSAAEQLFCTTVGEDVAFAPLNLGLSAEEISDRVKEALDLVGLSGWESKVPHHLSGGEKRKAALASVLSMKPDILLFDEPTSDLDSKSRKDLLEVVNTLPGTKIIASHDLEFLLDTCEKIVVLADGEVQLSAPPVEVFGEREALERAGLLISRGLHALLENMKKQLK